MIYRINSNNKPVPVSNPTFNNVATRVPVGFMMMYAGTKIPDGYMAAQGQSLLRADYPELFEIIGTTFGAADDEHFSLPDTREVAIVGAGTNPKSTEDVYNVGQFKEHQFASHTHAQASHTHTGTAHTHTMNHSHSATAHSHGSYTTGYRCSKSLTWTCTDSTWTSTWSYTSATAAGSSSTNICLTQAVTVGVCSATATTCASGASSGGTHGKRMGIYYIIKVEADQ